MKRLYYILLVGLMFPIAAVSATSWLKSLGENRPLPAVPFGHLDISGIEPAISLRSRHLTSSNPRPVRSTVGQSVVIADPQTQSQDPFFDPRPIRSKLNRANYRPQPSQLPGPAKDDLVLDPEFQNSNRVDAGLPSPPAARPTANPANVSPETPSFGIQSTNRTNPRPNYPNEFIDQPRLGFPAPNFSITPNRLQAPFVPGVLNQPLPCGCQPQCITTTVYVPHWETRYFQVPQTRYRQEMRQKKFRTNHVVYDMVPRTEAYTVMVPRYRTRNYSVNRKEEYQVEEQEDFTIMIPKPQQRQVSVDRVEEYQVPEEVPYTVMVPMPREIQETSYKTVVEQEPYQERYVVKVPKKRTRIVTTYKKQEVVNKVRKPVTRIVEEQRSRPIVRYKTETRTRMVREDFIRYEERKERKPVTRFRTVEKTRPIKHNSIGYQNKIATYNEIENQQIPIPREEIVNYKVAIPYTENVDETYFVNVPYEQEITRNIPIKIQTPRTVEKTYQVKIPVTEHRTHTFNIEVPYEVMRTQYRVITRQVPVTKYRTITRDMGSWRREQVSTPTCTLFSDACGCSSCTAGMRHTFKNVWIPRVVSQKIPYTDYRDVQERVPFQVPEIVKRIESRTRKVPVTKYRSETRTASLEVMDYRDSSRSMTFKVTKYRWEPRIRPVIVKRVREEVQQKRIPFVDYQSRETQKPVNITVKEPFTKEEVRQEKYTVQEPYTEFVTVTKTVPVNDFRMVPEEYVVRIPEDSEETYRVKVAKLEYVVEDQIDFIEIPVVKEVEFTEMVEEFRTRTKYRDVERRVPVYETKSVTEMVPQIRTRTSFRTETRTVADIQIKTFMKMVPEVRQRTVYKKRFRDVPMERTEVYWENVPEKRFRTTMTRVPRTVQREHVTNYSVNIPYQVNVTMAQKICRWIPKQIVVPVQPCCDECGAPYQQIQQATGAYLNYGAYQLRSAWDRIINR
ncbi:MAG: hypothetical protein AAF939_10060 [Planctomycetota bacterium]